MRERISIHAPHEGERPDGADNITDLAHISIHAPHEGERPSSAAFIASYRSISIHAPHEGERRSPPTAYRAKWRFQSTLPTRGSDCGRP